MGILSPGMLRGIFPLPVHGGWNVFCGLLFPGNVVPSGGIFVLPDIHPEKNINIASAVKHRMRHIFDFNLNKFFLLLFYCVQHNAFLLYLLRIILFCMILVLSNMEMYAKIKM